MRPDLIKARQAKNMSQQELAEIVGVTRQAICRLERGYMNGSERLWKSVSTALGARPEDLWHTDTKRASN